jgi:hypothetical protein
MIQTLEAIVDTTGKVNLLTEIHLKEDRRAIVTILDEKPKVISKIKSSSGIREMFGTWKSGNADSANNNQIDADLAKTYAENHED